MKQQLLVKLSMRWLPGPYLLDLDTRHRGRGAVPQFICRERGDSTFLIGADLVRECAGLEMKDDNLLRLVEGVRAVVSNRFCDQVADFLGTLLSGSLEAIFELSARAIMRKKRPSALKTVIPLGLVPNWFNLVPSART